MTRLAEVPLLEDAKRDCPVIDVLNAAPTPVATLLRSFLRFSMFNLSTRWTFRKTPDRKFGKSTVLRMTTKASDKIPALPRQAPFQARKSGWLVGIALLLGCLKGSIYFNPDPIPTQLHTGKRFTNEKAKWSCSQQGTSPCGSTLAVIIGILSLLPWSTCQGIFTARNIPAAG